MLFKKTLKVASATALWMVALLGANSAMATISLDGTPQAAAANAQATVTFSLEAIEADHNVSAAGQPKFYAVGVTNSSDALSTTLKLGIYHLAVDENTNLYLRYDLNEHLTLNSIADSDEEDFAVGASTGTATLESTLATDPFLLVQVGEATAGDITSDALITVNFRRLVATSGRGDGMVRVRGYTSALDAIAGAANALFDRSATLLKVARSLDVVVTSGMATADVETGFTKFIPNTNPTRLGSFNIMIEAAHLDPLGEGIMDVGADIEGGDVAAETSPGVLHDGLSKSVNVIFAKLGIANNVAAGTTTEIAAAPWRSRQDHRQRRPGLFVRYADLLQ